MISYGYNYCRAEKKYYLGPIHAEIAAIEKLPDLKRKKNLKFDFDDSVFILSSDKTKSILDTDCKIYEIKEDNKIIIGKRTRLIGYQSGEKIYAYADPESYKTLIIK